MEEKDRDRPYTPTPMVNRPRCKACNRKLYWDGYNAKWVCMHEPCSKSYDPEKICEQCGNSYISSQIHQKFCSSKCKEKAHWTRQNKMRKERYHSDPVYRQSEIDRSAAYYKNRMDTDPDFRDTRIQYGKDYYHRKRVEKEEE